MNTRKELSLVFFLIPFVLLLAACDLFENDSVVVDYGGTAAAQAFQATAVAGETLTAAPRETWTRQAHQTLTALPANETATGAAMGATETSAAVATQQLFTREAQTVAANLTATKIALERGTNTPTLTLTPSPTNTPTPTASPTPIPTRLVSSVPISPTIGNTIVTRLPVDQILLGETPNRAVSNVTDASLIYSSQRVDFLNQNGANTLINNWQAAGTSFTFVTNWFPTEDAAIQWQTLSAQNPPATAANDQPFDLGAFDGAAFRTVECKTGERTISGRQLETGDCDVFVENLHIGFNFLTTGAIRAVMNAKAPLILNAVAESVK